MSKLKVLSLILVLVLPVFLNAQTSSETLRAPDGGTMEMLTSIFVAPVPNAPFTTTLNTQWIRTLEDGSRLTLQNHRIIMRDSAGRIFQERCRLVPDGQQTTVYRFEISDPTKHEKYFCYPNQKNCVLRNYFAPTSPVVTGSARTANGETKTESLGTRLVSGVETIGTRETTFIKAGAVGNNLPLTITNEFWYSQKLGINLIVNRIDPRHGTENFEVQDLSTSEPSPALFSVPSGYKVIDQRKNIGGQQGADSQE